MAGFENSVLVAKNVNFDVTASPAHKGIITADGDFLIGSVDATPNTEITKGRLISPGGTLSIGYAYPDVTLDVNSGGFIWENIGASQSLVKQHGYFCSSGGALSLALPATSAVGDTIKVMLIGATSWTITQGAGQQIRIATSTTTSGAGGSLASQQQGDGVTLVCQAADTIWQVTDSIGGAFLVV